MNPESPYISRYQDFIRFAAEFHRINIPWLVEVDVIGSTTKISKSSDTSEWIKWLVENLSKVWNLAKQSGLILLETGGDGFVLVGEYLQVYKFYKSFKQLLSNETNLPIRCAIFPAQEGKDKVQQITFGNNTYHVFKFDTLREQMAALKGTRAKITDIDWPNLDNILANVRYNEGSLIRCEQTHSPVFTVVFELLNGDDPTQFTQNLFNLDDLWTGYIGKYFKFSLIDNKVILVIDPEMIYGEDGRSKVETLLVRLNDHLATTGNRVYMSYGHPTVVYYNEPHVHALGSDEAYTQLQYTDVLIPRINGLSKLQKYETGGLMSVCWFGDGLPWDVGVFDYISLVGSTVVWGFVGIREPVDAVNVTLNNVLKILSVRQNPARRALLAMLAIDPRYAEEALMNGQPKPSVSGPMSYPLIAEMLNLGQENNLAILNFLKSIPAMQKFSSNWFTGLLGFEAYDILARMLLQGIVLKDDRTGHWMVTPLATSVLSSLPNFQINPLIDTNFLFEYVADTKDPSKKHFTNLNNLSLLDIEILLTNEEVRKHPFYKNLIERYIWLSIENGMEIKSDIICHALGISNLNEYFRQENPNYLLSLIIYILQLSQDRSTKDQIVESIITLLNTPTHQELPEWLAFWICDSLGSRGLLNDEFKLTLRSRYELSSKKIPASILIKFLHPPKTQEQILKVLNAVQEQYKQGYPGRPVVSMILNLINKLDDNIKISMFIKYYDYLKHYPVLIARFLANNMQSLYKHYRDKDDFIRVVIQKVLFPFADADDKIGLDMVVNNLMYVIYICKNTFGGNLVLDDSKIIELFTLVDQIEDNLMVRAAMRHTALMFSQLSEYFKINSKLIIPHISKFIQDLNLIISMLHREQHPEHYTIQICEWIIDLFNYPNLFNQISQVNVHLWQQILQDINNNVDINKIILRIKSSLKKISLES